MMTFRKFTIVNMSVVSLIMTLLFTVNFVVDPYNFNNIFDFDFRKNVISKSKNYRLWKLSDLSRKSKSYVILGDSRSGNLEEVYFERLGVEGFYNLGYGGGTLSEAIDSFWIAAGNNKLEKVIFGVPFSLFNESNNLNLLLEAEDVMDNPFKYYLSSFTFSASYMNVYDKYIGRVAQEVPPMNKEAFWRHQLEGVTNGYYSTYVYPDRSLMKLKEISEYCAEMGIEFIFFIPPTHVDLQSRVADFSLTREYSLYKDDLCKIANVIDFDYLNKVTASKDNFTDPYHFNEKIAIKIVEEIVNDTQFFSKRCEIKEVDPII